MLNYWNCPCPSTAQLHAKSQVALLILDEARHTADPVHLVRVFGIIESTAMNYVYAAHPGRKSVIPR